MSARNRAARRGRVALPSAGQTIISFVLRRVAEGGPWPLTRVLSALGEFGVDRVGVARALGDRRGVPLVHSQELRWQGADLALEARHGRAGIDEMSLELPPWDELTRALDEDQVWRLIDTAAAGADAQFGSVGDGEPPDIELPRGPAAVRAQLHRHLALLLPGWSVEDVDEAGGTVARELVMSGLLVVTP